MKLLNWVKKTKTVNEIIDINITVGPQGNFEVKYKNGDVINYSIIDLVKQLDYIENKMDEKVASNIFFWAMGVFSVTILFSANSLMSNVKDKTDALKERLEPFEIVDKDLKTVDKELEAVDKELAKENQLLRERIIILEQKIK